MASPLLETKLYAPRWRRGLVARPRLVERLNRAVDSKLTLLSAPAGFGKTTLLAEWLDFFRHSAAWLSLDHGDNHAASFWSYLIAALQTVEPHVGANAMSLLQSPEPVPIDSVLTLLLNELSAISTDVVLVLDDYHLIDAREIQDGMLFLLDHLPPSLHLVFASRADPSVPLARLRARGELVEIRAADLRFTPDEAAAYLNEVMGLHLTAQDAAALESRTEGWIAALQLAALSMQGREDTASFIAGFSGDDRYIVDYLVEEVLQAQSASVRSFVLQTSILDQLSGSLCDAVTGQEGGKAMLEWLDRANLFVVPLDDRRLWYRYHRLFADVVHAHLLNEQPAQVPHLHRRASTWYAQNGNHSDAIGHALAGMDFPGAADLIELALQDARRNRLESTFLGWLMALPDEVMASRPVLSAAYAWALLSTGQLDGVEARLRSAERWLEGSNTSAGMVVVDAEEFRRLPGTIAIYRAARAQALGDVTETAKYAGRALDLLLEDDPLWRGAAAALMGLASWSSGDLETAHRMYAEGTANLQRAGHISDAIGCAIALADIRIAQGRLREGMRTYEWGLQLAAGHDPLREPDGSLREPQGGPLLRGAADMYVGMSEILRERGDLDGATQHLLRSQELGERTGLPQNRYRWCAAMARVRQVTGDLDGALALLDEAERVYANDFFPKVRPVAALKARVWVAQGKLDEALGWARVQRLSAQDELSYLREFEHITLARVLLAHRSIGETMAFLERLLQAAEQGARTRSVIDILVLQALAHQMHADVPAALVPVERALSLAEPEGYVRIFVDEGPAMAALLDAAAKQGIQPNYVRQLLAASGDTAADKPVLAEPLSERELEVLRLLATDLTGPEIARELVVSLNTVRSHTKNIYSKLGVNTRRAAVRRATELALS